MPKKRLEDSDSDETSDSGPDDGPVAKKSKSSSSDNGSSSKKKSGSGQKNEQGETYFSLDDKKRVTVRTFKGKVYVDIREFYEKDGKTLPGKKGISLTTSLWNNLKAKIDDIDSAVRETY